jgi:hypothetical protein
VALVAEGDLLVGESEFHVSALRVD